MRQRFSDWAAKDSDREPVTDTDAPFKNELARNPALLGWLLAHFEQTRNNALVGITRCSEQGNPVGVQFHSGRMATAINYLEFFKTPEAHSAKE